MSWRFITGLILLFVGATAYAQQSPLDSYAVGQDTDLSLYYLGSLFGNVGSVLSANNGQMLGQIFYRFNIGIIVVGLAFVSYTVCTQAMRLAFEGTAISQTRNSLFLVLRITIGFAFLVPNAATGYSYGQVLLMRVVVQSISFADATWEAALNWICYGERVQPGSSTNCTGGKHGVLWSPVDKSAAPVTSNVITEKKVSWESDLAKKLYVMGDGDSTVSACEQTRAKDHKLCKYYAKGSRNIHFPGVLKDDKFKDQPLIFKLFIAQVYSYQAQIHAASNGQLSMMAAQYDSKQRAWVFPAPKQKDQGSWGIKSGAISGALFSEKLATALAQPGSDPSDNEYRQAKTLYGAVIQRIAPAAKEYVCSYAFNTKKDFSLDWPNRGVAEQWCSGAAPREFGSTGFAKLQQGEAFWRAYSALVPPLVTLLNSRATDSARQGGTTTLDAGVTKFISSAKSDGWMMAGAFYWNLSMVVKQVDAAASKGASADSIESLHDDFEPRTLISSSDSNFLGTLNSEKNQTKGCFAFSRERDGGWGPMTPESVLCGFSASPLDRVRVTKGSWGDDAGFQYWQSPVDQGGTNPSGNYLQVMAMSSLVSITKKLDQWALPKDEGAGQVTQRTSGGAGNAKEGEVSENAFSQGGGLLATVFASVFYPILQPIVDLIRLFNFGFEYNPLLFVAKVGASCLGVSAMFFLSWVGANIATFSIISVCRFNQRQTVDAKGPLDKIFDNFKPVVMVVSAAFFGVGVYLVYYVPLYPYLIFLFGVMGWFVAVIEGMVAMPLVFLGLTHPEGHDILGPSEQAVMLVLGLFVRPALMVIGFVSGMILSFVAFQILIYSFSYFLQALYVTPQNVVNNIWDVEMIGNNTVMTAALIAMGHLWFAGGTVMGSVLILIVTVPFFCLIFTSTIITITEQCYNVIYILPNYVLRWIGAPEQSLGMQPSQMAGQVKGGLTSATSQVGSMAGQYAREAEGKQKKPEMPVSEGGGGATKSK